MKKIIILLIFLVVIIFLVILSDKVFVVFSQPKVISFSPVGIDIKENSLIEIKFDKPIKRREVKISVEPQVYGEISFKDSVIESHLYKTIVFTPAVVLEKGIEYKVVVENIQGFGLKNNGSLEFSFKTEKVEEIIELEIKEEKPEITILNIPIDWQDDALSCEAASLKMALYGKGVIVSEYEIMEKIGYDNTLKTSKVWGDPYEKYVGDIDGKMCQTGYGVYWEPVAKAALNWRPAQAFSNWSIEELTKEISLGNPVVFWGVLPNVSLIDCSWHTPERKYIKAFKQTHVRLIIGFIGPKENPSKIIINDPLSGQLYWSTSSFLDNWKVFDYSGVVVR